MRKRGETSKVKISDLRTYMNIQTLACPWGQNKGNGRMKRTRRDTSPTRAGERNGGKWSGGRNEFSKRPLCSGRPCQWGRALSDNEQDTSLASTKMCDYEKGMLTCEHADTYSTKWKVKAVKIIYAVRPQYAPNTTILCYQATCKTT